ncbi:hypothetical protein C3F00_008315 [Pseudomonas sp. MWU13-2860]|nr:hypothetical protein C3F00_008315 [Pseudomonas sp. MWU13-2860]
MMSAESLMIIVSSGGDSGFCRHRMFDWCDGQQTVYVVGPARNAGLQQLAAPAMQVVTGAYQQTGPELT